MNLKTIPLGCGSVANLAEMKGNQDADVVAFIHRLEVFRKKGEAIADEGKAEIIVAKQRNGPTDTVGLAFVKQYTRFENLALEKSFQV